MSLIVNNPVSRKEVRGGMIFIITIIAAVVVMLLGAQHDKNVFKTRGKITLGTIIEVRPKVKGGGCCMTVQICVNENYFTDDVCELYLSLEEATVLKNRNISIPVLYDSVNPANMDAMTFKEDFDYYEINYPDSLQQLHNMILQLNR